MALSYFDDSEEERLRRILALDPRLAAAFSRVQMPQVVQATPATPLPGAPVQAAVRAPQSEQLFNLVNVAPPQTQVQQQPAFDANAPVRTLLANQPPPLETGNKTVDAILRNNYDAQKRSAENLLTIMSQAQMNPEERQIIEDRKARLEKARERAIKDEKDAGWDALLQASSALMRSKGRFGQALGEASAIGSEAYDRARQAARDKMEAIDTAQEEGRLSLLRGTQAAQDRALAVYNAALAAGKTESEARTAAVRDAEFMATSGDRIKLSDLSVQQAEADLADTKRGRGRGPGGTPGPKPMSTSDRVDVTSRLVTAYDEQNEAYAAWKEAGSPLIGTIKPNDPGYAKALAYQAKRDKVNNLRILLGQPSLGPAPVVAGSNARVSPDGRVRRVDPRTGAPVAPPKQKPKPPAPPRTSSPKPKNFPDSQKVWDALTPAEKKKWTGGK